jgi:hypothetical protein
MKLPFVVPNSHLGPGLGKAQRGVFPSKLGRVLRLEGLGNTSFGVGQFNF